MNQYTTTKTNQNKGAKQGQKTNQIKCSEVLVYVYCT